MHIHIDMFQTIHPSAEAHRSAQNAYPHPQLGKTLLLVISIPYTGAIFGT